ncbi:hypothetical protein [Tessaracoccus defluvii]|uniref:hypothetical protein n=1 Tax=Tessaracoccus defluvii TaxID=1285901 RepID=UPI0031D4F581
MVGEVGQAGAQEHGIGPDAVLVDEPEVGRGRRQRRAADGDVAVTRLAFSRAISVARSSVAMRVLPTTSVRVDENTTLGSSCQILANSSSSGLNPASAEAVSHTTIVS